jgi:tight adherence protein B
MQNAAAIDPAPALLLRRPQRLARRGGPLFGLGTRLNAALAATGDRIGMIHLAIAGLFSATLVMFFVRGLMGLELLGAILLSAAAAVVGVILLLRTAQRRYQTQFLEVFPDSLDLIGRGVKAGLPVLDAMEVATQAVPAPVGSEFGRILDEVRLGVEIVDALQHAAERVRVPEFRFFVVALALQNRTGGSLAETLGNLSGIIRRRKELRLKVRAFTAESRMSVVVLTVLPFIAAGLMSFINHDLMVALITDPRGRFMVGLALISLTTGTAVMSYMIKRSLR